MNRDEHSRTFLEKNVDPIEQKARLYMLDAVACDMHNEGYSLDGNTEASDIRWFARLLYDSDDQRLHWDNAGDEMRDRYLRLAVTTMKAIPALMGRMSARCIRISKAVNTIIKAEKLREKVQEGKHNGR